MRKFISVLRLHTIVALAWCFAFSAKAQCFDALVALDGSGDFTSIQEAIDSAPGDLEAPFIIYIKNGVYDEKLFIEKNFITLVGEDRDSTIITTAVLRRVWRETNTSDWGAATINIASDATDLTLAHLTVRNNFADVFPDFPDNNDHTFAIRGGGHRVIIIDCNIIATGGDTLSLWNTSGGMFYHNDCYIEGYVDFIAPRGYCHIRNSTFFGYNSTASIWHDGSGGEDHKLVIENSLFTGVQNFALGRYHRDASFYLLDCTFDETMKNQEIYHTGSDPLQWGERVYYYNCHRPFVNWSWYKDNLMESGSVQNRGEVTPEWTFKGEWDPEALIDGLLPYAFLPFPENQSACADSVILLTWVPGMCADAHLVYFGKSSTPMLMAETTEPSYTISDLEPGTHYFWRVDEITGMDTTAGTTWEFTTAEIDGKPSRVFEPFPADGAEYETNVIRLDWDYYTCNTDSFMVWYGDTPDNLVYQTSLKYPPYFRQLDDDNKTYYWRIDSKSESGVTEGPIWSFRLNPTTSATVPQAEVSKFITVIPNPTSGITSVQLRLLKPGTVTTDIIDVNGTLLSSETDTFGTDGIHVMEVFDASEYLSGIYFCRLRTEDWSEMTRIVVNH